MNEILRDIKPLLEGKEALLKDFKKETYSELFNTYREKNKGFFEELDKLLAEEEAAEELAALSTLIVDYAAGEMEKLKGKMKRESEQLNYNMFMAVYFIPAVLEGKQENAKNFTDGICEKWAERFKGNQIKSAEFDTIMGGFKTKLCYITTAVCKSLHKPENCYELELLRDYRDNYLMQTGRGAELVAKYYDIAPTIVKRIDKSGNAEAKYRYIWENWLKPCIAAIENKALEECGRTYVDMVEELQDEYIITAKNCRAKNCRAESCRVKRSVTEQGEL